MFCFVKESMEKTHTCVVKVFLHVLEETQHLKHLILDCLEACSLQCLRLFNQVTCEFMDLC